MIGNRSVSVASLFASDVYQNYTAWYTWVSNQAAHAGLGCMAALIAMATLPWIDANRWALFAVYPCKEGWDYVRAARINRPPFPLKRREILMDCTTDVAFVSVGVLIAALTPLSVHDILLSLAAAVAVALGLTPPFRRSKQGFDRSGMPFLFRLATFHARRWEHAEGPIRGLLNSTGPTHLILHGPAGSGKTSLAIGIACEGVNSNQRVLYLPPGRLIEELASPTEPRGTDEPWRVTDAEVLVVDDVWNLAGLSSLAASSTTLSVLASKRGVWSVAAQGDPGVILKQLIAATGLPPDSFCVIDVAAMGYRRP
jgi:hypothetical protein